MQCWRHSVVRACKWVLDTNEQWCWMHISLSFMATRNEDEQSLHTIHCIRNENNTRRNAADAREACACVFVCLWWDVGDIDYLLSHRYPCWGIYNKMSAYDDACHVFDSRVIFLSLALSPSRSSVVLFSPLQSILHVFLIILLQLLCITR